MENYKKWLKLGSLGSVVIFIGLLAGCATTSQVEELRMKVDQALQQSQHAADMAKDIQTKCLNLKTDATEEYRAAGAAADRAEKAAQRAENAAKSAMDSADRAEENAQKIQKIYDRIMSK